MLSRAQFRLIYGHRCVGQHEPCNHLPLGLYLKNGTNLKSDVEYFFYVEEMAKVVDYDESCRWKER